MKITIVYSLPASRMDNSKYAIADEDSALIAHKVCEGLQFKGYKTELYPISENEINKISEVKADCVFNLIEWCGQDIELASKAFKELRNLNIPVTGADEKRYVLTGDKVELKKVLLTNNIPTPRGISLLSGEEVLPSEITYPLIIKPSLEHCSMGLTYESIAHNQDELRVIAHKQIADFMQPALAEEFIVGREFMVYLIEEEGETLVLPIEEIIFHSAHPTPFQTYDAKWNEESSEYKSTDVQIAKLSKQEQEEIEQVAIKTFSVLGLRGYSRLDMRMRNSKAYVLEANANPAAFDGDPNIPDINSEVIWGIKFPDYLEKIVQAAIWHYQRGERV